METNPEDVAKWLARETGHAPEAEEGYSEEATEEGPRKIGLPQDKHEKLRRFFDGLHVERSLQERRRAESLNAVDEADMMNQSLKAAIPQGPQAPTTPPGGGF